MWGIAGKKDNTIGIEDTVQLLFLNEEQTSNQGVIWVIRHGCPAWFVSSASSGQAYRCLWCGLYGLSRESVSLLCPGPCKPESWDDSGMGGPWLTSQLELSSSFVHKLICPSQVGWFLKKIKVWCTATDTKFPSTSFTSQWKLWGQLVCMLKIYWNAVLTDMLMGCFPMCVLPAYDLHWPFHLPHN